MPQQTCVFSIGNQGLKLESNLTIMAHTKNYLSARFNFGGGWAGIPKTAVFFDWGKTAYSVVLSESNTCTVPWEVIQAPGFQVAVYGGDFAITNTVVVPVRHSDYVEGSVPLEPTPDVYNQLLTLVQAERQLAQASAQEASEDAAVTQADRAIILEQGVQISQTASDTLAARAEAIQAAESASESAAMAANNLLNGVGTHNLSPTAHSDLRDDIRQAEAIARGRATAHVFDTLAAMAAWLAVPANVETLVVGDNLYIRDTGVKDYWWDGTEAQELEAEAPDLTDYYTKTEIGGMMPILVTRSQYTSLETAGQILAGRVYDIVEDGQL